MGKRFTVCHSILQNHFSLYILDWRDFGEALLLAATDWFLMKQVSEPISSTVTGDVNQPILREFTLFFSPGHWTVSQARSRSNSVTEAFFGGIYSRVLGSTLGKESFSCS